MGLRPKRRSWSSAVMFEILEKDLTKESLQFSRVHVHNLCMKKSCLKGIQAHWICDTGAVLLLQTSCQQGDSDFEIF